MRFRAALLCCCASLLSVIGCQDPAAESRRTASEPFPMPEISEPTPESTVRINPVMTGEGLRLQDRQLLVDGKPFAMRAVCWNPVRKGGTHPDGLMYRNPSSVDLELIDRDFQLMSELGVNTIRTYEPILHDQVLALVQKHKLRLIVPVFNYFATDMAEVEARVRKLKDHPATLIWEIGNEWNYNQFYSVGVKPIGFEAAKSLVKKVAAAVRAVDQRLPISTVYGELPPQELIAELSAVDIWGLNIYSGLSFGERFKSWRNLSTKPMYLGEYGADAINRTAVDEPSQAKAVVTLSQEIAADDAVIGGAVFEWNDEWWKDGNGKSYEQDIGGIAPGGGPYPDMVFNEEWWGLVDIDRQPRLVYRELQKLWKQVVSEETF